MKMNRAFALEKNIGLLLVLSSCIWMAFHLGRPANRITDVLVGAGAVGVIMILHVEIKARKRSSN